MSGHSKWHNIRVKKTATDAARGKIYTRHARLIEIAAQRGGDPVTNAALRAAIDNAKEENVPNANIERAIKKGTGELKGAQMEEVMYAAMGPSGVACLIECLTDNRNRTISNVKNAVQKNGGNFAETSSVTWMFDRKGVVVAKNTSGKNLEEIELELIDFGAQDVELDGDTLSVTTSLADWTKARDFLKNNGFEVISGGLKYVPSQKVAISDKETAQKLFSFLEAVEEDDDVSEVHTNADIDATVVSSMQ